MLLLVGFVTGLRDAVVYHVAGFWLGSGHASGVLDGPVAGLLFVVVLITLVTLFGLGVRVDGDGLLRRTSVGLDGYTNGFRLLMSRLFRAALSVVCIRRGVVSDTLLSGTLRGVSAAEITFAGPLSCCASSLRIDARGLRMRPTGLPPVCNLRLEIA